jgi:hypothetical protein
VPKIPTRRLKRVHIHIYEVDYTRLHQIFDTNPGFSEGIREVLHKFCNQMEAKVQATVQRNNYVPPADTSLD